MPLANLEGLLFDLDGVIYRGQEPLPGAAELSPTLRRLGIRYAFVTNNATLTPGQFRRKLAAMGVQARAREIITSPIATATYLRTIAPAGTSVFVVGEHGLRHALATAGYAVDGPAPEYVVVGLDRRVTYARLAGACDALRRGARLVATNADPAIPVEGGMAPGAGAILAAITTVTGATPVVIGKPQPTLLQVALARIDVAPERAAIVGDQIGTDIRAGRAAGVRTVLVDARGDGDAGEPRPDLRVRDVAQLLGLLAGEP